MPRVIYLRVPFEPVDDDIEGELNGLAEAIVIASRNQCKLDTESIMVHVGPLAIGEVGAEAMVKFLGLPRSVETYAQIDGFGMCRVQAIRRGVFSNESGWFAVYRFQF